MSPPPDAYCIDTSAILKLWHEYPPDIFEGLWSAIDELIDEGRLWIPKDVVEEIKHRDGEGLSEWVKVRARAHIDFDDPSWLAFGKVTERFPAWVNPRTGKNAADPVVVAHAIARGLTVVSDETASRSEREIKIPNVCSEFGVVHVRIPGFFRSMKLRL